jgi:hypothetical protein
MQCVYNRPAIVLQSLWNFLTLSIDFHSILLTFTLLSRCNRYASAQLSLKIHSTFALQSIALNFLLFIEYSLRFHALFALQLQ